MTASAPRPDYREFYTGRRVMITGGLRFINLAGQLSHVDSMLALYRDLESNCSDFVDVDDACDAFLRAGADDAANGQVLNVGGAEPIAHRDLVDMLIATAGSGRYRFVEWPPEKKAIDIGDFYTDSTLIARTLGWQPHVGLRDGLARTIGFYRQHLPHYISTASPAHVL